MVRKRKKSISQKAISTATMGVPSPVRKVLTSRVGAPLTVLIVGALAATGVIRFQWQGGRPHMSVDKERAAVVKQQVDEYVDGAEFRLPQLPERPAAGFLPPQAAAPSDGGLIPSFGGQAAAPANPPSYPFGNFGNASLQPPPPNPEQPGNPVTRRIPNFGRRLTTPH